MLYKIKTTSLLPKDSILNSPWFDVVESQEGHRTDSLCTSSCAVRQQAFFRRFERANGKSSLHVRRAAFLGSPTTRCSNGVKEVSMYRWEVPETMTKLEGHVGILTLVESPQPKIDRKCSPRRAAPIFALRHALAGWYLFSYCSLPTLRLSHRAYLV